jgi:hypothetical protein
MVYSGPLARHHRGRDNDKHGMRDPSHVGDAFSNVRGALIGEIVPELDHEPRPRPADDVAARSTFDLAAEIRAEANRLPHALDEPRLPTG